MGTRSYSSSILGVRPRLRIILHHELGEFPYVFGGRLRIDARFDVTLRTALVCVAHDLNDGVEEKTAKKKMMIKWKKVKMEVVRKKKAGRLVAVTVSASAEHH